MTAIFNPLELTGKTVLVTGASSGIGREVSVTLSRLGARVVVSGRRPEALTRTLEMMDQSRLHLAAPFDLTQIDAISSWLESVVGQLGSPLNGVVHCAGVVKYTPIRALNQRSIDDILVVNLHAALMLIKAVTAKGIGDRPAVVLLSSISSLTGRPGLLAYTAAKGAINSAVRCASVELADRGARVNCVALGWVDTRILEEARHYSEEGVARTLQRQFLGVIQPAEVAVLVSYLVSDASRHVTGSTWVMDGGYTSW